MPEFVKDVEAIRRRAAEKIEEGAVTQSYKGDVQRTISILNEALATEIVCVLRYMHHYFMATGVHGAGVADEFKEHADAERQHADSIAGRIQQLGGKPDFNPRSLVQRSVSQYIEGETLADMIREDLIAERMVIEVYQEMVRYFANNDPTTRHMVEEILADEEEHASDLSDLLYIVDPESGKTEGEDPGADPLQLEHGGEQGRRPMAREGRSNEREQRTGTNGGRNKSQKSGRGGAVDEREALEALGRINQGGHPRQGGGQQQGRGNAGEQEFGGGRRGGMGGERGSEARGNRTDLSTAGIRVGGGNRGNESRGENRGERGNEGRGTATSGGRSGAQERGSQRGRDAGQSGQRGQGSGREGGDVHTPGVTGRPMNRRAQAEPIEPEVAEHEAAGGMSGGTRRVAVTNKKNKRRAA